MPLCFRKKREGDTKMPTKWNGLIVCWNKTKDWNDMLLEENLQTISLIFETHRKDPKGSVLTINIIKMTMKGEDNVGIDGAVPMVHPPSTTYYCCWSICFSVAS